MSGMSRHQWVRWQALSVPMKCYCCIVAKIRVGRYAVCGGDSVIILISDVDYVYWEYWNDTVIFEEPKTKEQHTPGNDIVD